MRLLFAGLGALLLAAPVYAQTPPSVAAAPVKAAPELEARVKELIYVLSDRGDYETLFAPAFRAAVTKEAFASVNAQLAASAGKVTGLDSLVATDPLKAKLGIAYERGIATMQIVVDPAPPHQIIGLRVAGMNTREASLEAIVASLASLPGTTGLAFARLDDAGPVVLKAHQADRPFATGSEFKLVILAELVRAIGAGERRWSDMITLDGGPLPGGAYTASAAGTQVSIYDVAEKMISVSDNSATDILLKLLGRNKVEAMLPVVGVRNPAGMRPFLSTLEAFKLKGSPLGARWQALNEAGRRALLAGEVAAMPVSAIDTTMFAAGKPLLIDSVEWFATPADMIRVMDWLRRHSETGEAARARAILAKNSGIGAGSASNWQYVGFKGGSESGVIAMTLLLQAKDGRWHALSASWNNGAAAVEDMRFAGLIGRAVELAATTTP